MAISVKDLRELLAVFPEDAMLDVRKNGWGDPALVILSEGTALPIVVGGGGTEVSKFKVGDRVRVLPVSERNRTVPQADIPEQEFVVTATSESQFYGPYVEGDKEGRGVYEVNVRKVPETVTASNEVFIVYSNGRKVGEWESRDEAVKHASEELSNGGSSAQILVSTVSAVTLKDDEWRSVLSGIGNDRIKKKILEQLDT